ncbi:MAG: translocation/assembly module TamB [Treponema sp.]|nr:translocation/assembly module TamB [Treponema sp.]
MDIYVPRDTPIPFGFDITGFLAKGDVSGQLQLSMENLVFDISGDLYANNTEIGLNTDEITRAQGVDIFSSTILPVTLNLKIITGPTVEFLWPSSDFPILRANPDMGTVVEVNLDTPARQFSLNSDVKIRGGEIFYFERSFYIRQGTLSFHENELQFTPQLTARAEARDRSDEGPVTISMIVENAPLLSFTARFESSPPLSQMEIFELLGQNLTGAQVDESTGGIQRAFLNSSSDLLAQFTVVRRLERYVRNFLHLDMLSARTQVLQNAFFRAAGIQQTPVDMNSGVGNYFDNTTVFLGKYIGADMFIQSMLSMRYDENKTTFGGLSFEPDVGVELQTPLFSIRWDFIPTHPENWYVNDNSITLTWSRSF